MNKFKIILLLGFISIFLLKCSNNPTQSNNIRFIRPDSVVDMTSSEIFDFVRLGPNYPQGFYREMFDGKLYYETNASTDPAHNNKWMTQLCTDNRDSAYSLSKNSIFSDSTLEYFSERETDKYFEFHWPYHQNNMYSKYISRVHKRSYVDRSMYEYDIVNRSHDTLFGILNERPITRANAKEVVEYLWFTMYQNGGYSAKILQTSFTETDSTFNHSLLTFYYSVACPLNTVNDFDTCRITKIEIVRNDFNVFRHSGEIIFKPDTLEKVYIQ